NYLVAGVILTNLLSSQPAFIVRENPKISNTIMDVTTLYNILFYSLMVRLVGMKELGEIHAVEDDNEYQGHPHHKRNSLA
ncbi:MAG: hypothetical protein Q8757_02615, partial [Candidatus Phytoplasma australasiaticum]|nr:hypothetical protein [Candidatus Phytoplasma australasiaticum]